ncbi:MAG: hypothetical protein H6962_01750 [Chromatiaceae bacterium]|nr:hypothetical protein [Chromatiaceae bacterium]
MFSGLFHSAVILAVFIPGPATVQSAPEERMVPINLDMFELPSPPKAVETEPEPPALPEPVQVEELPPPEEIVQQPPEPLPQEPTPEPVPEPHCGGTSKTTGQTGEKNRRCRQHVRHNVVEPRRPWRVPHRSQRGLCVMS